MSRSESIGGTCPHGTREVSPLLLLAVLVLPPLFVGGLTASNHQVPGSAATGLAIAGAVLLFTSGFLRLTWHHTLFHSYAVTGDLPRRTVPIAGVKTGEFVAVSGRVVRGDGEVRSPLSGRTGLFVRIEVNSYVTGRAGGRGFWFAEHKDVSAAPFWIADGSGVEMCVTKPIEVDVERDGNTTQYDSDCGLDGFSKPLRGYLRAQKGLALSLRGKDRVRVYETVVGEGPVVTVAGPLSLDPDAPYRGGASKGHKGAVWAFLGELDELREYGTRGARRRRLLTAFVAAGAVTLLVGVVWRAIDKTPDHVRSRSGQDRRR